MFTKNPSQNPSSSERLKPNIECAQTNLQLLNQLRTEGYSDTDIKIVFNAYKAAACLFANQLRPSGKTFIAHLVGTASILVNFHFPSKIVAAGLLHSAYLYGKFGNINKKGITEIKRKWLIQAVGSEVEEYVTRYSVLKWNNSQTLSLICKSLDSLEQIEKEVLLIRLANELDEYQDFGILYLPEARQKRYSNRHTQIVQMAENLGFPLLASEFEKIKKEMSSVTICKELRYCEESEKISFIPFPIPFPSQKSTLTQITRKIIYKLKKLIIYSWQRR